LPPSKMTIADLSRLLKSDEIQKAIRAPKKEVKHRVLKRNPLKNHVVMAKLNPYASVQRNTAKAVEAQRKKIKQERMDAKRGIVSEGSAKGGKPRPRVTAGKVAGGKKKPSGGDAKKAPPAKK